MDIKKSFKNQRESRFSPLTLFYSMKIDRSFLPTAVEKERTFSMIVWFNEL